MQEQGSHAARMRAAKLVPWAAAAVLTLSAAGWAYRDYRVWRELGVGGLPATLKGWLRTSRLRLQKRNALDVSALRSLRGSAGDVNLLAALPPRRTPRPRVAPHPVPHRQLSQRIDPALVDALQAAFDEAILANERTVRYALSYFEKHMPAITCCEGVGDPIGFASHGEIAHIHALDGSMHMILSPSDAVIAVEAGWAELHGLAGRSLGLPDAYLMVYAPQSTQDVGVIGRLLAAAIAYMTLRPSE